MKRTFRFATVVLTTVVVFNVASYASEFDSSVPEPIQQAMMFRPIDMFVGIGVARLETIGQSRAAAISEALGEIVFEIDHYTRVMINAYGLGEGKDILSSQITETVSNTLSQQVIRGVVITEEYLSPNGEYWVVIMLPKNAHRTLESSVEVSNMLSSGIDEIIFAIERMEEAFSMRQQNNELLIQSADD